MSIVRVPRRPATAARCLLSTPRPSATLRSASPSADASMLAAPADASMDNAPAAAAASSAAHAGATGGLWLQSHESAADKPQFMLRLPQGTTHVALELKLVTTDGLGRRHETTSEFDGAPSAAWMRNEEQTGGGAAASDAAAAADHSRSQAALTHTQPKTHKRSHSKKANKASTSSSSSARSKLRVRGDQPVSPSPSAAATSSSAATPSSSPKATKAGKSGRGKLVSIVGKEDHKGAKRWRCQWQDGSESWEDGEYLNRPTNSNTQRIFLSYEAKLGADLKKAARSTSGHHNDEEKGSDESEDVPELQEDEGFPERILDDRVGAGGVVEYLVQWWCPEDARTQSPPEISWEPACHLEGSQQLLQDYFRERSRKEKERTAAGKKAALINSGQSDDEMSDDGLKQYEGQF